MNEINNNKLEIPTRFEPDVNFYVMPAITVSFKETVDTDLEKLKNRLIKEALERAEPEFYPLLRRAANEAMAIAYTTPYPTLFYPLLFEEKAAKMRNVFKKQRFIKEKTRQLVVQSV